SLDDQKPAKLSETDNGNKAESGSQTEEYQGLLKENEAIDKAYRMGLDKAKTVEDRKEAREKLLTEPRIKLASKFLELAEKYPKDDVALKSLLWIRDTSRMSIFLDAESAKRWNGPADKALEFLFKHHLENDELAKVCQSLCVGYDSREDVLLKTA